MRAARMPGPSPATAGATTSDAGFEKLAAQLGGSVGLACVTAGDGLDRGVESGAESGVESGVESGADRGVTRLGSWQTGPGWSTVKVPVAMAAIAKAQGHPDSRVQRLIQLSATASDNAAAEQLWTYLGEPETAASQVQAVLRSAGDVDTSVQSQRVRPPFSAFGQTKWSLTNQALFMAALPCLDHSDELLALMGQVAEGQRWGIGSVGLPAQFKGGWGPDQDGGYLVRQMGIVTLANGSRIGLALASEPADGRFETGTANLTALARWAVANAATSAATGPGGC